MFVNAGDRAGRRRYGSGLFLIAEATTAGVQASVTFTNISSIVCRHLRIIISGRSDTNATNTTVSVQLNGDTGANYDSVGTQTQGGGSTATATNFGSTAFIMGNISAATAPANDASTTDVWIFDVKGTKFIKDGAFTSGVRTANLSGNLFTNQGHIWYKGTIAVINQIKAFPTAGNFVPGSVVSLYGSF